MIDLETDERELLSDFRKGGDAALARFCRTPH